MMGNGQPPGPATDVTGTTAVDDGTLPLMPSPPPAAIGLDARSGAARGSTTSLADQIVSFARQRRGDRVGDGECFTLADRALRRAGARSATDFGTITPDADYAWGTAVAMADVRPGDVIQFRNYRYDREVETANADGSTQTNTDFQERPHHTAVVERVDGNGAITVLEQNSPDGAPVVRTQLFFSSRNEASGNRTTTISVQGTFWFYRPQAR